MGLINDLSIINMISWLILGLSVGYMTHLVDGREIRGGLIGSLLMGVLGAVLGGFLANLIFGVGIAGFDVPSLLFSIAGAVILTVFQRVFSSEIQSNPEIKETGDYDLPVDQDSITEVYEQGDLAYFSQVTPLKTDYRLNNYLKRVSFPASKSDLISFADHEDASYQTLETLEQLPDHIFTSEEELRNSIDQIRS